MPLFWQWWCPAHTIPQLRLRHLSDFDSTNLLGKDRTLAIQLYNTMYVVVTWIQQFWNWLYKLIWLYLYQWENYLPRKYNFKYNRQKISWNTSNTRHRDVCEFTKKIYRNISKILDKYEIFTNLFLLFRGCLQGALHLWNFELQFCSWDMLSWWKVSIFTAPRN